MNALECTSVSVVLVILFASTLGRDDISGYYWRDFTGSIPYDAVSGGLENGRKTYVGQALFKELIVPAKIVPEEKLAYFEWGFQVHSTSENVKILCTRYPERFEWIPSSRNDFTKIKDRYFVVGGTEKSLDAVLFFARKKNNKDVITGKLLTTSIAVLFSEYNGASSETYEFEVLSYNPPATEDLGCVKICNCTTKSVTLNLFS